MAQSASAAKGRTRASNPESSAPATRVRKPRPNGSTADYSKSTRMTPLLEQFALEYLIDFNAAAAWRRAHEKIGKPVPKNSAAGGYNALKHPMVQQRAAKAREIALAKAGITVEKTETEIARLAYVDIGDAFDGQMMFKPLHEMSEETRRCIAAVEVEELYERVGPDRERILVGHLRKVKFWDKPKSLEMAARRDGIFKDKLVHEAGASLEKIIADSYKVGS